MRKIIDRDTSLRQTGRTSKQMLATPKHGIFVIPDPATRFYMNGLAAHLRRSDITFITPENLYGFTFQFVTGISVDHSICLDQSELQNYIIIWGNAKSGRYSRAA